MSNDNFWSDVPVDFARVRLSRNAWGWVCTLSGRQKNDAPYWHGKGDSPESAFADAFANSLNGFEGEGVSIPARTSQGVRILGMEDDLESDCPTLTDVTVEWIEPNDRAFHADKFRVAKDSKQTWTATYSEVEDFALNLISFLQERRDEE